MWRMMEEGKEKELVKGGEGMCVKWRRWQEHGGGEGGESVTIGGEEYIWKWDKIVDGGENVEELGEGLD